MNPIELLETLVIARLGLDIPHYNLKPSILLTSTPLLVSHSLSGNKTPTNEQINKQRKKSKNQKLQNPNNEQQQKQTKNQK